MFDKVDVNPAVRQYVITTGTYDNYKILEWLVAPRDKNIDKLYNEFKAAYFPNYQFGLLMGTDLHSMRAYNKNRDYKLDGIRKLQRDGYQGNTFAEVFVSWLKREHNFQEQRSNEVWVES